MKQQFLRPEAKFSFPGNGVPVRFFEKESGQQFEKGTVDLAEEGRKNLPVQATFTGPFAPKAET